MNVHVNENCIGCGLCVNMCGSVFLMTEEGVAAARDEIFPEQEGQVQEAAELRAEWFEGAESVGICGATSTPKWLMQDVADAIGNLNSEFRIQNS